MNQMDIFGYTMPDFKIRKKIRLISTFSGIGFQEMALRDLGLDFEIYKTCEWDVNAVFSAKEIYKKNDYTNYSEKLSKEELIQELYSFGISNDGKEPMKIESIRRKHEDWLRMTYNNIKATHNLVDITKVHGKDLEIVDKDKYCYLFTYSFPCQDLSKAGKQKGMAKDSGTRSSMLWEVERILEELYKSNQMPDVLLMENVPDVIGTKNIRQFNQWYAKLESLGYQSYYKTLNAKDYSIPQNRERTFMVSILGDYNYTWPKGIPLSLNLKDMLEEQVDERYYLTEEQIKSFKSISDKHKEKANGFEFKPTVGDGTAKCITTRNGYRITDNFIIEEGTLEIDGWNDSIKRVYSVEGLSPCITTMGGGNTQPKILEPVICSSRGRNPDNPKSRKSGLPTVQMLEINDSGCSDTITTVQKDNLVLIPSIYQRGLKVPEATKKGYAIAEVGDSINLEQPNSKTRRGRVGKGTAQTLTTSCNQGIVNDDLKIRKLTPLECWRLMGATDDDFYKAAKVNSNSQLYKEAGNGIVKHVLMAIINQMIPDDYKFKKGVKKNERNKI